MGKLLLPSIFFFVVINTSSAQLVQYGQPCSPNAILTPSYCRLYDRTVSCTRGFEGICNCTLGEDANFDEESEMCLNKVGVICLTEDSGLGRMPCVTGADCETDPSYSRVGSTVGTCQCLDGYQAMPDGTCEQIDDTPATPRSTTTKMPIFQTQSTTTLDPTRSTTTEENKDENGTSWLQISNFLIIFSFLFVTSSKLV